MSPFLNGDVVSILSAVVCQVNNAVAMSMQCLVMFANGCTMFVQCMPYLNDVMLVFVTCVPAMFACEVSEGLYCVYI